MPPPGTTVMEKYVVEELLGVGGMGAVVSARRSFDGVRVALKVMLAAEAKHEDSTRRFFREARAAGVIDSPHVAKLLDFGRLHDGTPFMVLELLHGQGLDQIIRERAPLEIEEAIDLILQAAEGVAEAHARGIVHRDIKPSNLHVTRATDGSSLLKVLDFGISKATLKLDSGTDAPSLTETNATLGSPQYMSPEQLRSSKDVDARTDVWSLGLILHKLLTGRPAFEAPNVGAHFAMILADPPTRLRDRRPDAPVELEDAILTCLEKEPERRWQDLGQLAQALAPFGHKAAALRAQRICAILNNAGVRSKSRPRVHRPDDPTIRDAPRSKRPEHGIIAPPIPGPPNVPSDMRVSSSAPPEIGELTKSAWSPGAGPIDAPARRARRVMIGIGVLGLVAVAFGAGTLMKEEEPVAAATSVALPSPTIPPPADTADDRKERWIERAEAGIASPEELRKLEALCVLEGDDDCVAIAKAAAIPSAEPEASTEPVESEPTPRVRPKSKPEPTPEPTPEPAPEPVADPDPQPKVKPKGPMVDTL